MALQPYEFLVRWDHITGALKGAHVKVFDASTMTEGDAQPVAMAGAAGFPIADVLTKIEVGAIAAADDLRSQLQTEVSAHAATAGELSEARLALAAAQATIATLQRQVDAAQT